MDLPETRYEDVREPTVEEASRCHAILPDGERCANPAVEGRRYCALPEHEALADRPTDHVGAPAAEQAQRAAELPARDRERLEEQAAGEEAAEIGGAPQSEPEIEAVDPAARPVADADDGEGPGAEDPESFPARVEDRPEDADLTPDAQEPEAPGRRLADHRVEP